MTTIPPDSAGGWHAPINPPAYQHMPEPSDAELMQRFLAGRADLLAYLRAVGPAELAEDAFQETFLVVQRRLADFQRNGSFGAWTRGIGRMLLRKLVEKRGRLRPMADDSLAAMIDDSLAEFEEREPTASEDLPRLQRCLQRLGDEQRRLLDLRYGQNLSLEAISAASRRSSGAVQVALSRIRSALAICIERQRQASA